MGILIILISIYLISAILTYIYVKLSHSKNGIHSTLNPDSRDLFNTFCPITNTLSIILWIVDFPLLGTGNYSKFFNIKK